MNIMLMVETFLYAVSTMLYYPVMLGLVALVFYVLILVGSLLRERFDRRSGLRPAIDTYRADLTHLLNITAPEHLHLEIENLLQATERRVSAAVERARFVVRAGPGVGLMGTLIPMGVALSALANGSMPEMAMLMVNAFNSAVVGLGAGVVAFAIALVREQWLRADVQAMRYLTERTLIDGEVQSLVQSDIEAAATSEAPCA